MVMMIKMIVMTTKIHDDDDDDDDDEDDDDEDDDDDAATVVVVSTTVIILVIPIVAPPPPPPPPQLSQTSPIEHPLLDSISWSPFLCGTFDSGSTNEFLEKDTHSPSVDSPWKDENSAACTPK